MKIIVNKEAANKRMEDLVNGILDEAQNKAKKGKTYFIFSFHFDDMNGIDIRDLVNMVIDKSEGTVRINTQSSSMISNYFKIEIIEP